MASALIGGLAEGGHRPTDIWVSDPHADKCQALSERYGIQSAADNGTLVAAVEIIVLAVKPQAIATLCHALSSCGATPLWVSVAAGVTTDQLAGWLGGNPAIVRVMPNTPALLGAGASGLFANAQVTEKQKEHCFSIFEAVGKAVWLEQEAHMDIVTALSGSGPAYFFAWIQALIDAATHAGLPLPIAQTLAIQTALGAAKMAEADDDIATLKQRVTSPGGTTQAGLEVLDEAHFSQTIDAVIRAAIDRGKALSAMHSGGQHEPRK